MRLLMLGIVLVALSVPKAANAQAKDAADRISQGIMVIREMCGTQGNTATQKEVVGKLEGGITLKQPPGLSAGAELKYTNQEAEGLAGALFKELTDNATSLSKKQIECISPFISRILNSILGPASQSNPPPEPDLNSYEVSDRDVLCRRLHEVVEAYRGSFKPIILGTSNMPGQYRARVILPNTVWCSIFTMPYPYYSCSIFYNEKNAHNAILKENAYRKTVGECLGKNWTASDVVSNNKGGYSGNFQGDGTDPKIDLRSTKDDDGTALAIYVEPPG